MKRRCPDCRIRLRFRFLLDTWMGVLRYWRCTSCRSRFVTHGNGPAEEAF